MFLRCFYCLILSFFRSNKTLFSFHTLFPKQTLRLLASKCLNWVKIRSETFIIQQTDWWIVLHMKFDMKRKQTLTVCVCFSSSWETFPPSNTFCVCSLFVYNIITSFNERRFTARCPSEPSRAVPLSRKRLCGPKIGNVCVVCLSPVTWSKTIHRTNCVLFQE